MLPVPLLVLVVPIWVGSEALMPADIFGVSACHNLHGANSAEAAASLIGGELVWL
jgi:hypothetical protein